MCVFLALNYDIHRHSVLSGLQVGGAGAVHGLSALPATAIQPAALVLARDCRLPQAECRHGTNATFGDWTSATTAPGVWNSQRVTGDPSLSERVLANFLPRKQLQPFAARLLLSCRWLSVRHVRVLCQNS